MSLFDISLYILEILIAVLAIYAAETKNLAYAILSLLGISVLTAIIFYMLGAIFVSVVQLAVFSGAIVIMFGKLSFQSKCDSMFTNSEYRYIANYI